MNLTLHPASARLVDAYAAHPPHALLITGRTGGGMQAAAEYIAAKQGSTILRVLPEKDDKVDLEAGSIGVETIRTLYEQTRAKQRRVIIIGQAERMTAQAQNAFLKLLEEPGEDTIFILATHDPQLLLPTIHSRVQHVELRPISREASLQLITLLGVTDATKQQQLLYIGQGLPEKLTQLVNDPELFEQEAQRVRDAKELLQAPAYQKLLVAQRYKTDRPGSLALLDIALAMTRQSLVAAFDIRLKTRLDNLLDIHQAISRNGNIRLQLARLAL